MASSLYLRRDVYFCECDGAIVILDLPGDRYLRFTGQQGAWFQSLYQEHGQQSTGEAAQKFADKLVAAGILTGVANSGMPIRPTSSKQSGLAEDSPWQERCPPKLSSIFPVAAAAIGASVTERTRSLSRTINAIRRWKDTRTLISGADRQRVLDLTSTFHALAPFFFSTQDACRYRSLCLLRYFQIHGIAADWIFGVRLAPFGAHCWVQWEDIVLNDYPDTVREYQHIMIV